MNGERISEARRQNPPAFERSWNEYQTEKCFFLSKTIDYFVHAIAPGRRQLVQKTTKGVKMLHYPTNVSEMRAILGLCNVWRQFVPNLARLPSVLSKKLKIGAFRQFRLDDTKCNAVDACKKKLVTTHVLALPRLNEKYAIGMDACDKQVGCYLLQGREDKPLKPFG